MFERLRPTCWGEQRSASADVQHAQFCIAQIFVATQDIGLVCVRILRAVNAIFLIVVQFKLLACKRKHAVKMRKVKYAFEPACSRGVRGSPLSLSISVWRCRSRMYSVMPPLSQTDFRSQVGKVRIVEADRSFVSSLLVARLGLRHWLQGWREMSRPTPRATWRVARLACLWFRPWQVARRFPSGR